MSEYEGKLNYCDGDTAWKLYLEGRDYLIGKACREDDAKEIVLRWNSQPDLLEACLNSPAPNMIALFADFAEECSGKPSMAVYKGKFIGLTTFLRSCVDRAEKIQAALAKAQSKTSVINQISEP